jgi:hypothetical protein
MNRSTVYRNELTSLAATYGMTPLEMQCLLLDCFSLRDVDSLITHWATLRKQNQLTINELSNLKLLAVYISDLLSQIRSY